MPKKIGSYHALIAGQIVVVSIYSSSAIHEYGKLLEVNVRPKSEEVRLGLEQSGRIGGQR